MAKKLSKTQKYKKSVKKKNAKKIEEKSVVTSKEESLNSSSSSKSAVAVDKKKVLYNVFLDKIKQLKDYGVKTLKKISFNNSEDKKKASKGSTVKQQNNTKKAIAVDKNSVLYNIFINKPTPVKKKKGKERKYNKFLDFIFSNCHVFFSAIVILVFIFLLIGLINVDSFKTGTIVYVGVILFFLIAIAISYNRYTSGKIFSLVLCLGMSLYIYHLNYTYDFIRNLDSRNYEYKTYYLVTFDNNINKKIYSLNNKKVALLVDNSVNVERQLNTKLDSVKYVEFEDFELMIEGFYNQDYRGVILTPNQYKYLDNCLYENKRSSKILYEFKANAKK